MKHQTKPPRPVATGTAAGLGYLVRDNGPNNTAARHEPQGSAKRTFADWCQTDAPYQLSLDEELVAWLCRPAHQAAISGFACVESSLSHGEGAVLAHRGKL
jgi:hypothetical protein